MFRCAFLWENDANYLFIEASEQNARQTKRKTFAFEFYHQDFIPKTRRAQCVWLWASKPTLLRVVDILSEKTPLFVYKKQNKK